MNFEFESAHEILNLNLVFFKVNEFEFKNKKQNEWSNQAVAKGGEGRGHTPITAPCAPVLVY